MSDIDWQGDVPEEAPDSIQERLYKLVDELSILNEEQTEAEDKLGEINQRIAEIKTVLVPGVLEELGVSEIKLEDKTKIKVETKVNASIKKENEPIVFAWLIENEFGGLIKSNIKAEFPREEVERAMQVVAALREDGIDATVSQNVHNATLKSFVKEQLEAGQPLCEQISVFEYKEAKITLPKVKK